MSYYLDPDMLEEAQAAHRTVSYRAASLRRRAHLDYRDPDALSEEEMEELDRLEDWEP